MKGLDAFLGQRLKIETRINDPYQNIKVGGKRFDEAALRESAPAAAVAVGLALRKAGDR